MVLPAWVEEVVASKSEDGPELEAAVLALQNSPLVKAVEKIKNNSGIYATLWCVAAHSKRNSEQRQLTQERTTFAACARSLLDLVNTKHSGHLEVALAARIAAAAKQESAAGPSAPTSAFAAMAATAHVQPAADKAAAAERLAAEARAKQRDVCLLYTSPSPRDS